MTRLVLLATVIIAGCTTMQPRTVPEFHCAATDIPGWYCCAAQELTAMPSAVLLTAGTCGCFRYDGPPLGAR